MKLVLHIGDAKTGTSALQQFFYDFSANFRAEGVLYLHDEGRVDFRTLSLITRTEIARGQFNQLRGVTDSRSREFVRGRVVDELKQRVDEAGECDTALISSEHLFFMLTEQGDIADLKRMLDSFFADIQVILYLRNPVKKAPSYYSTLVKNGGVMTFSRFINFYCRKRLKVADSLNNWISVFGVNSVTIRVFDKRALRNGSFQDDFMSMAGIKNVVGAPFPSKNVRLSRSSLRKLLVRNILTPVCLFDSPENQSKRARYIEALESIEGDTYRPSGRNATRIMQAYRAQNVEGLSRHFAGREAELAMLMDEPG